MQLFVLNFCELQFSKFCCQFRLIQMQLKKQKEPFVKWNRILLNPAASQNTSSVVRTLWSVPLSLSLQARVSAQASVSGRTWIGTTQAMWVSLRTYCTSASRNTARCTHAGGRGAGACQRARGGAKRAGPNQNPGEEYGRGVSFSLSLSLWAARTRGRMCWSHGGARCFENALISSRNVRNEAWTARLDRTHTHTHTHTHM